MATEATRHSTHTAYAQTKGGRAPFRTATPIELVADLLDENGVLLVDGDPGAPSTIGGGAR